jgi:predicted CopG family antitoxin
LENNDSDNQKVADQIYEYAANLLVKEKKSRSEVIDALIDQGIDEEISTIIVENLGDEIDKLKKEGAQKDMLYGALWCVGGFILTLSDIGLIFWGAIVFGAIQFFKGLFNS